MMELADSFVPLENTPSHTSTTSTEETLITVQEWHRKTRVTPQKGPHRLKVTIGGVHFLATTNAHSLKHMLERYKQERGVDHVLTQVGTAWDAYYKRPRTDKEHAAARDTAHSGHLMEGLSPHET